MQTQIPHFRRRTGCGADKHAEFIEMDGECVYKISDMRDFYNAFGYMHDKAKAGILPDEFIWEEYIKDRDLTHTECLQIHLIEYLREHSDKFRADYMDQSVGWMSSRLETISSTLCPGCRMHSFCSKRLNESIPGYCLSDPGKH